MSAEIEMPRYKCHKEVHALKINGIELDIVSARHEGRETDGSAVLTPADGNYAPFRVPSDFVARNKLIVGGYYVVYADGYKSFSPPDAFEQGYTEIK